MSLPLPEKIQAAISRLYTRLTGEPYTATMDKFIKGLGWVSVGFVVAKGLTVLVNILAGRLLGPVEYGRYNLALSVGAFASPGMFGGLYMAMIRYASGTPQETRKKVYSTALSVATVLFLFWGAVYLLFREPLAGLFGIDVPLYVYGIFYGIAYGLFLLFSSFFQAEAQFRLRAFAEIVFAAAFLTGFGFWVAASARYTSVLLAIMCAYGVGCLYTVAKRPELFRFGISREFFKPLYVYGFWVMILGLCQSFQVFFIRFVINHYLSEADVGLISAYTLSSLVLGFYLSLIFTTVFFPSASAHADKGALWTKLGKVTRFLSLPCVVLFTGTQLLAILILGQKFVLRWDIVLPMALIATVAMGQSAFGWLLAAEGLRGMKRMVLIGVLSSAITVGMSFVLIPGWGLRGAVAVYGLAYVTGLILVLRSRGILSAAPSSTPSF